MTTLMTLYNLLQINRKIEDKDIRYLYLKDVWGLEQSTIGELEGVSQSHVSKEILKARKRIESLDVLTDMWTPEEIKYIHMLPREILPDIVAIAFINDLLEVRPIHPFFDYMDTTANARIAALAWLGVMNKRLMEIFNKKQPTISMIVQRSKERIATIERPTRYLPVDEYRFAKIVPRETSNFIKAGGQEL